FFFRLRSPQTSTLFPYTTLFRSVLGIKVQQEKAGNMNLAVLEHGPDGNGGCLIPNAKEVSGAGILVYMNVDGRIRDAVRQAERQDRKSTRLNSSHRTISYAVFCL